MKCTVARQVIIAMMFTYFCCRNVWRGFDKVAVTKQLDFRMCPVECSEAFLS